MKKYIFISFYLFLATSLFAQISVVDTISGGSYAISGSQKIDSLVMQNAKASCATLKRNTSAANAVKQKKIDPCANNSKVLGYKIQVMYSKNRTEIAKVMKKFSGEFPTLQPEMRYTSPDYRLMAGDFFTKRSAGADLARVKKKYPSAFLVSWSVWCRKAK